MKRHNKSTLIIYGLIVLRTIALSAQSPLLPDRHLILDRERVKMDMTLVPTGILSDVGAAIVEFDAFNGQEFTSDNYVNHDTFKALLNGLASSKVGEGLTFPTDFPEQISQYFRDNNCNPVSIIAYEYSKVKDFAIEQQLLSIDNNDAYHDAYTTDGEWINPYEEKYLVAFSPYINVVGNTVTYSFPKDFRFSNLNIRSMSFNPGDGAGFRNLSLGDTNCTAYYKSPAAPIDLQLYITLTDNTVLVAHSRVTVLSNPTKPDDAYEHYQFTASRSYSGHQPTATVSVMKGTVLPFNKPFIVAEGFDPISDVLGIMGSPAPAGLGFLSASSTEDLVPTGCDLIYIDWLDSCAPIEANADILKQVIQWVNANKTGADKNIVLGQSMGGLIARYALCEMEAQNVPHDVGTFISHDSPHLGANVPLGLVYAAQHILGFYEDYRWLTDLLLQVANITKGVQHTWRDVNPYIQEVLALRDAPSVQQMLLYYVDESFEVDHELYYAFQNRLNSLGFPKGDNGEDILNLCLTHGGVNNYTDLNSPLLSINGSLDFGLWLNWLWPFQLFNRLTFGILGVLPGTSDLSLDLSAHPFIFSGTEVYSATCTYTKRHGILKDQTHTYFNYHFKAPAASFYPDSAHGSYYDLRIQNPGKNSNSFFVGSYDYEINLPEKFMFIPTLSSLCYSGSRGGLTNANNGIDFTNPDTVLPDIPFDGYKIVDEMNATEHINLNKNNDNVKAWISRMLSLSISPSPEEIVATHKFTITDTDKTSAITYTVNWSISDSSVATIDKSTGILTPDLGGSAIVYANIKCSDGGYLRLQRKVIIPEEAFPGFPQYKLSYSVFTPFDNSIPPTEYTVSAKAQSSVDKRFSLFFIYHWGYKESVNGDIIWTASPFSDFSLTIPFSASSRTVYFYVEYRGETSPTYSVTCNLPLIAVVDESGNLYTEDMEEPFIQVRGGNMTGDCFSVSCMGHDLYFESVPKCAAVFEELLRHEDFIKAVKDLRPWGDKDCVMIPLCLSAAGETQEDFLTIFFDSTIRQTNK